MMKNQWVGRVIKVAWRGHVSSIQNIGRGLLHGTVLGPILFIIVLVDFYEVLEGLSIKFLIYADDIFIY